MCGAVRRLVLVLWPAVALCVSVSFAQEVITPDDVSICKSAGGAVQDNTRSCYKTTINASPSCTLSSIFTGQVIPTIQVAGNQSVSGIFSPQFFSENETYPANVLCRYNVQCPPNHLLYFQVVRQQLEEESNGNCLDSLDIERPALNSRLSTCGSEVEGFSDLELGRLDVQFLTNSRVEDRGFFLFAVCFDPEKQDQPGCANPLGSRDYTRGKRWRVHTFKLAIDEVLSYNDYTLTVRRGDLVTLVIRGIRIFKTFRKPSQYLTFYTGTDDTFPGTGILQVGLRIAAYIVQGVDQKFLPSTAESQVITSLLNQLLPAFSVADLPLSGPTGGTRRKRDEDEESAESAEDHLNACSAVLSVVANAVQERQLGYQFEV